MGLGFRNGEERTHAAGEASVVRLAYDEAAIVYCLAIANTHPASSTPTGMPAPVVVQFSFRPDAHYL